MKPIIGIFATVDGEGRTSVLPAYGEAIERAGGIPVLFPYTVGMTALPDLIALCHGFLFAGGPDLDPCHYGEERMAACGTVEEKRDTLDLAAFPHAYASGKPILGICRGAQLVNVALGGTLYQDIPTQLKNVLPHVQTEAKNAPSHEVRLVGNTPLAALIGKPGMTANSFHHQAIKTLGKGLAVMAEADDGIVEALYATDNRYLRAYQWHPERLRGEDADNHKLFLDFVNACKETER